MPIVAAEGEVTWTGGCVRRGWTVVFRPGLVEEMAALVQCWRIAVGLELRLRAKGMQHVTQRLMGKNRKAALKNNLPGADQGLVRETGDLE